MNTICLIGRLTRDPELRHTQSGTAVANFAIAVDREYKDADGQRGVDFIECTAWRKTGEFIAKYFGKGDSIGLKGKLQSRKYTDKEDRERTAWEVIAETAYFCGARKAAQGSEPEAQTSEFAEIDDESELPF